jgi:uncharacterized protein YegL
LPRGEPGPFAACVLLIDCSSSMRTGDAIGEVNRGLQQFAVEVNDDELARNRADIAVIALQDPGLRVESPFTLARDFRPPMLSADGATPMGGAIRLGLDTIETRRAEYRSRGARAYAAMMFLITDGEPTDDVAAAAGEAHALERAGKLNFFCIGTKEANFERLAAISPPERTPARLEAGKFRELFKWISDSLSVTAKSRPGEKPPLPPAQGWMSLQT